jgi:hypothetical protein
VDEGVFGSIYTWQANGGPGRGETVPASQ